MKSYIHATEREREDIPSNTSWRAEGKEPFSSLDAKQKDEDGRVGGGVD